MGAVGAMAFRDGRYGHTGRHDPPGLNFMCAMMMDVRVLICDFDRRRVPLAETRLDVGGAGSFRYSTFAL